ncbi:MAG: N-acetyltransferase [Rhodobacter sp.]|jgi:putative acetyltransferase|nr:N-acetyltransferase [Rhodobacter sp.]
MDFVADHEEHVDEIARLFSVTFTASEGADEGVLIGRLALRLMTKTPPEDVRVLVAWDSGAAVGAIIFSRLTYESDNRLVFVLGPVAVAPDRQNEGIGQRLIAWGIDLLRQEGVDIALTYGDPGFYRRVGFRAIAQDEVSAPFPLQHPEGWLGQSLSGAPITPIKGPARCVAAFDDPVFW